MNPSSFINKVNPYIAISSKLTHSFWEGVGRHGSFRKFTIHKSQGVLETNKIHKAPPQGYRSSEQLLGEERLIC